MSQLHADLLTVLDAVETLTPTGYKLRGQEARELGQGTAPDASRWPFAAAGVGQRETRSTSEEVLQSSPVLPPVVSALASDLYIEQYVRPSSTVRSQSEISAERDFLASLSAVNTGHGTWEPGWKILKVDRDGRLAVAKDYLTLWVQPSDLRTSQHPLELGDYGRVRIPKEFRHLLPGYYLAIGDGDAGHLHDRPEPMVRFYWHLKVSGAVPFIGAASATFNALGIPFRAKVLNDPNTYHRADAGVLYLDKEVCHKIREALSHIHRTVAPHLRPEVPLFTKALAPGVGFAEQPGNGPRNKVRIRAPVYTRWWTFSSRRD